MARREPLARKRERAGRIYDLLAREYPESGIALDYQSPFQLLIATILSAQCTDERVNQVTPELFERFPGPADFDRASQEELEEAIFSTGFYRQKARSIKGACRAILEEHDGQVPRTMEELVALKGVGRKTANVLLGHCFDTPGVVVDTHVKRLSNLLGLVDESDPETIERELGELLPPERWVLISHLFADHGRAVCVARRPKCEVCVVNELCPSAKVGST